jgi:deoxyribodipyrimidine photo-lyase
MLNHNFFWFRRDLRLHDNHGLFKALSENESLVPIFIFDQNILSLLPKNDRRVQFIHSQVEKIKIQLRERGSDLWVFYGTPESVFKELISKYKVSSVYANEDYEPLARKRDQAIKLIFEAESIPLKLFKDQVIFEKSEVLTGAGKPYTVFTPYKKKWLSLFNSTELQAFKSEDLSHRFYKTNHAQSLVTLEEMGFLHQAKTYPESQFISEVIKTYDQTRDFPALSSGVSRLGLHFRFGTISVREMVKSAVKLNQTWLSQLIWREFFMQILWHEARLVHQSFKPEYDSIAWRQSKSDYQKWCEGKTGYPLVDAGLRELNATGYMHNRVRMVAASFLTKHLLMHWSLGEKYFAEKLLDYDLSANNGNWQWAAGSGCDAAPYFRIFNPEAQLKKFDPELLYTKAWVPEYGTDKYVKPMVDHQEARGRALFEYGRALKKG